MILSDEVIKDGLNYHNHWISLSREILAKSHLEANARIQELETKLREWQINAQGWYERYVICCENSKLDLEAEREQLEVAEAKLRELAEAAEWRDECNDLFTDMNIDWINGRSEGPHIDSIYEISEEAEIAYEKALVAAKEEL